MPNLSSNRWYDFFLKFLWYRIEALIWILSFLNFSEGAESVRKKQPWHKRHSPEIFHRRHVAHAAEASLARISWWGHALQSFIIYRTNSLFTFFVHVEEFRHNNETFSTRLWLHDYSRGIVQYVGVGCVGIVTDTTGIDHETFVLGTGRLFMESFYFYFLSSTFPKDALSFRPHAGRHSRPPGKLLKKKKKKVWLAHSHSGLREKGIYIFVLKSGSEFGWIDAISIKRQKPQPDLYFD